MPHLKEITAMCHKATRDRYVYFVNTDTAIISAEDLINDLEQECEKYN